jgi:peptide/nickel transport system substrate-binding protein
MLLGLVAAACGSDDDGGVSGGPAAEGGNAVFGAEQWPECLNAITSCFNASWASWSIFQHVLPQAMTLDKDSNYVPGAMLDGEPEITSEDPFTVTFNIDPDAVWDDGTAITSADIEFTWRAHLETEGAITTTGYDVIDTIDTSDPKAAVVTFTEIYAPWRDLFGGIDYVLPAHLFESANVAAEMNDMIAFSGGPWVLQSWSDTEAVLVRNAAYWDEDRIPVLDQVTFIPLEDTDTELSSLQSPDGVSAIFPQASPGIEQRLNDPIAFEVGAGAVLEGLWPNHSEPPLDEKAVREALLYAIDRPAIAEAVFGGINPGTLDCAGWAPAIGPWCDESDFGDVEQDLDLAAELLTDAGWALNGAGNWEKDGTELVITWNTVAGNVRRETVQEIVQEQVREFGIQFDIQNYDAGELFQNRLPELNFGMGLYAQVGTPDPSVTAIYKSDQIPSEENSKAGQNFTAYPNADLDAILDASDRAADLDERLDLINQVGDIIREDVVWIPLYPLPNVTAWRTDVLTGPIPDFVSSPLGGFANMYDWGLVA